MGFRIVRQATLLIACALILGCSSLSELLICNDTDKSFEFVAQSYFDQPQDKKSSGSLVPGQEADLCRFYVYGPTRIHLVTTERGKKKTYTIGEQQIPEYLAHASTGGSTIALHVTDRGVEFEQRVWSGLDNLIRGWMLACFLIPAGVLFALLYFGWRRQRRTEVKSAQVPSLFVLGVYS